MEFDPIGTAVPQMIVAEVRAEQQERERARIASEAQVARAWRPAAGRFRRP